jgi:hypothetical protein
LLILVITFNMEKSNTSTTLGGGGIGIINFNY